ncbi:hypothetical protein [Aquirufa sp.]|jgi:hypothetical protein|uniref:hypothetical protein n=1 Tax=Aquirufa sp. TaxID=2676249 RepID=UPI0037BF741B
MKNVGVTSVLFSIIFLLNACSVSQTTFVSDDLYDSYQKSEARVAKQKKAAYLNFEDDAQIIQEDEATVIQEDEDVNFLSSRAVYQQGFNSGFNQGLFTSNPWNNWYANPYINFGFGFPNRWYSPLQAWRLHDPFYSGFPMGANFGFFGGMGFSSFNTFGFTSPYGFFDPFYGFVGPGMMFGNGIAYNYYNGFGQNYFGGNNFRPNVVNNQEPAPRYLRGPRDAGSSNRYGGENYSNTPRGGSNTYNTQGTNQPRVNSSPSYTTSPVQAAPRRNTNVEYRPSAPQQNYGQSRTESYSAPSSNYSSGSYGGGSYGGGGGSSSGGSSRGPR